MTGSKKAYYPSIPRAKDPATAVRALTENIEILTGSRGDGLDKAVTRRELAGTGVFSYGPGGRGRVGDLVPNIPVTPGGVDYPTMPENVQATGGFTFIMVEWDQPNFSGFAYAEVWRSVDDDFGTAVRVATTEATIYIDPVELESGYYYWVRFANINGVVGPLHGTAGVYAETARDIDKIREALLDVITSTQLASALRTRIDLVDAAADITGSVNARIAAEAAARLADVTGINAAISSEQTSRINGDNALASSITSLIATVNGNTALIAAEQTTRANADEALAEDIVLLYAETAANAAGILTEQTARATADYAFSTSISSLTANVSANAAAITTEQTARATADSALAENITSLAANVSGNTAAITAEQTARADGDSALSATITALSATVSGNTAAITTEQTARATADSALSESISTLSATVGDNTAAIETTQTVVDGIAANYMVKLDVNGYVSGFGLYNLGAGSSGFIVHAANFSIGVPDIGGSEVIKYPFMIGTVNGVTTIVLDGATFIADATITTAKIANLAVDSAKIADLAVGTAKIASAAISSAKIAALAVGTAHISDAAITTAKIGTAQIDSLRLGANVVTVPAGASVTSNQLVTTSFATITDAFGGGTVTVNWGTTAPPEMVQVIVFANFSPQGTGSDQRSIAIRVNASVGGSGGDVGKTTLKGYSDALATVWGYTGHSGTVTYSLQARCAESGTDYRIAGMGMLIIGLRR